MTIGTISRSRRVATRAWWIACSSPSSAAWRCPASASTRRPRLCASGVRSSARAAARGDARRRGLAVEVARMSGCPADIVLWASMRLAAIDIGTNSVHMIVAQVRPDQSFEIIDREKEMVRLGAGGLDGRALTPAAMAGGLEALSKFRRLADSHKVDEIIAAATSATREAENGGDFLATVRDRTGIVVRVISGAEEARLIHIAATYGIDLGEAPRRGHRHRRRQRRDHARRRARAGARQELQGRRDPAHRAVRPRRPDRPARRAAAGGTHRSGDRPARRPDRRTRLSARHRHVGDDPQPRVRRARR